MRIFDIEDAANGLLLEPLPRVALVDARSIGKLGGASALPSASGW